MSHVRDLALLEKWTEATSGIHTISPTSPKATSFCCCPQRRRYNLNHPKKHQLQQQQQSQKFFDEHDFRLIEDATKEIPLQQQHDTNSSIHNSSNNKSINSCTSNDVVDCAATHKLKKKWREQAAIEQRSEPTNDTIALQTKNNIASEKSEQHLIAAVGVSIRGAVEAVVLTKPNTLGADEQWRHDKDCGNNSNFSDSNIDNNCRCEQEAAITKTWTSNQQLADSGTATQIIKNNNSFIIAGDQTADIVEVGRREELQQQQQQHKYKQSSVYDCVERDIKQIQRLSNNNINHNNKENKTSNNEDCCSSPDKCDNHPHHNQGEISNCSPNIRYCSNCQLCLQQNFTIENDSNIDINDDNNILNSDQQQEQQNKMTITTTATSVENCNRSECGLNATTALSDITAETTIPTTQTSQTTTPHITTVIKTTMVKRSPNEQTTTTPTTATSTTTTAVITKPTTAAATNAATAMINTVVPATNPEVLEKKQIYNKQLSCSTNNNNKNNTFINSSKCDESTSLKPMLPQQQQLHSGKSVKERIAAYAAGNDQIKNHDNGLRKSQCISNKNNMTPTFKSSIENISKTVEQSSAINILNENDKINSSSNCIQRRPTSPASTSSLSSLNSAVSGSSGTSLVAATESGSSSPTPSKNSTNFAKNVDSYANVTSTTAAAPTTTPKDTASNCLNLAGVARLRRIARVNSFGNSGAATMPRLRSPQAVNTERSIKHGSNSTALTTDKEFLGCAHKPQQIVDRKAEVAPNLAALDNLDLALSLNLNDEENGGDDDGEDPYIVLQEYLERVKHEINEVFELHKARQRMQQKQQELQHEEQNVDEQARFTESDSGFDSASGQGRSKLTKRSIQVATTSDNKVIDKFASNDQSDFDDQTSVTATTTIVPLDKSLQLNQMDTATIAANTDEQLTPTTTNLHALPPPPLSPQLMLTAKNNNSSNKNSSNNTNDNKSNYNISSTETLLRLRQQLLAKADSAATADEVNIWANKFLRDLANLMETDKSTVANSSSSLQTQQPLQREQSPMNSLVLKPEKHATIPLQSFNLDCSGLVDSAHSSSSCNSNARTNTTNVTYLRTLSAPTPFQYQNQQHYDCRASMANGIGNTGNRRNFETFLGEPNCNGNNNSSSSRKQQHQSLTNFQRTLTPNLTTILKIEEAAAAAAAIATADDVLARLQDGSSSTTTTTTTTLLLNEELQRQKRQRQLKNDMETIRSALLSQSQQLAAMEENSIGPSNCSNIATTTSMTFMTKQERINQAGNTTTSLASTLSKSLTSTAMTSSKITTTPTSTSTTTSLLNSNDTTKKGSTSTIWTSEESILRSVGAVDEDNNSTSSSACEEASGVLSSGKSGISLDSSGLDNDNNESGIGTATPPKELSYWKIAQNQHLHPHQHQHHNHHQQNDNESVSSLDVLRKMKFQKSNSVASSDDPDLLEVLSLCDEPQGDDDVCAELTESLNDIDIEAQQQKNHRNHHHRHKHFQRDQLKKQSLQLCDLHNSPILQVEDVDDIDDDDATHIDADEVDEGHDEFETLTFCDCSDFIDGDTSSNNCHRPNNKITNQINLSNKKFSNDAQTVVLRRKYNAAPPIMVPYGRAQKCRSHSLDTSSLPSSYQNYHLQQQQHNHHHHNFHHPHHHYTTPMSRKLHQHIHPGRTKERAQLTLALRQEPFQSLLSPNQLQELPSPSSASLHSGHESLGIQELTTKSNSAPLLLKQERKRDDFAAQNLTLRYSRSQSDRYLAEIEAVEACKWLRAAGFPQYAQMYEDHQFPIDLTNVAKDHTNLENDQLQSLYRRLCVLNRCANMRLDQSHKAQTPQKEDSDDENFALSENWTFQPHIRRWSRIGEMGLELPTAGKVNADKTESSSKESSPDRFEDDAYDVTGAGLSLTLPTVGITGADSASCSMHEGADATAVRLRRSGSERFKDGAKALLRRVESIKSRRRKRQNREGIVISGPQALDLSQLGQRSSLRKPDAVYSTPPSPSAVSPMHTFPKSPFFGNELKVPSQSEHFLSPNRSSPKRTPTTPRSMRTSPLHFFCSSASPMPHLREGRSDDSSSYFSDSQESSAGGIVTISTRKMPSKTRRFLQRTGKVDDIATHSDSECHQGRKLLIKDANTSANEVKVKKLTRGGSLNLGKDPKKREGLRSSSFRSRSTTRKDIKTTDDGDHAKRTPVVRWHSFQMEERPHMIFRKCFSQKIDPNATDPGVPFAAMSAGQLQIIRKLALVILTGYMERHCPTHRSGWNWELPKFIKKIKMPDYKEKKVFGVPLLLILQRTGQTLPLAVRSAFRWLQLNALDQIGLFRKSGVKSRIIKLKELIEFSETQTECMDVFDGHQAYDIADMLKQYFRDLPESLLTTKMSETFATIFQHLPPEVRLDAVQCAVLLLPDENRETLYALLEFLTLVADNSQNNQMTANNLAVCLAPSLFHNSISTGAGSVAASPRRRGKGAGVPDVKELTEAKASHECLAFMIINYRQIYTATKEKINKCNFGYLEESKPVSLEALGEGGQWHDWRGYLYECTNATIKEGREKTRGWFTVNSITDPAVEIAYKKVGDGIPLRLWRCITEVEGPPKDVLDYIIRQRASWDINLLQSQTVKKLDEHTEIFQYAVDGQVPADFCVLRSWQTDLPRGACVIVENSIDHPKAKTIYGSVRGVVLASRYLIEPCGSGRSRLLHLARVDIKGKTPEWYNKSFGHISSHYLSRIRHAFKNIAEGPESKV